MYKKQRNQIDILTFDNELILSYENFRYGFKIEERNFEEMKEAFYLKGTLELLLEQIQTQFNL